MKRLCVALCLLCVIILPLLAQEISLRHVQTPDRLTTVKINHAIRSSDGYLWLATRDGLVRYDGYACRLYPLSSDFAAQAEISTLIEDPCGGLWICVDDEWYPFDPSSGIISRDKTSTFSRPGMNGTPGLITKGPDNEMWIYTSADSVFHLPAGSSAARPITFGSYPSLKGKCVTGFVNSDRYTTAVTDRGEIYRLSSQTHRVEEYDDHITTARAAGGKTVSASYSLLYDREGLLWIYGLEGLWLYDSNRRMWLDDQLPPEIRTSSVRAMTQDSRGRIWLASDRNALRQVERIAGRYVFTRRATTEPSLSADATITTLSEDRNGTLWIGTMKHGLFYTDECAPKFTLTPLADIGFILPNADGSVWLATENDGVALWTPSSGTATYYNISDKGTPAIRTLLKHPDGTLYATTESGGLWKIDGGRLTRVATNSPADNSLISHLVTTPGDELLLATGGSTLLLFNPTTGRSEEVTTVSATSPSVIRSLTVAPDGKIYFATDSGIGLLRPGRRNASVLKGPWKGQLNSILADGAGRVWIASDESLDLYIPESGEFSRILSTDSLSGEILSLAEGGEGSVWAIAKNGLVHISLSGETGGTANTTVYGEESGLPVGYLNHTALAVLPDGEVIVGSIYGLSSLNPDRPHLSRSAPKILFVEAEVDGQPAEMKTEGDSPLLSLRSKDRNISIMAATDNPALSGIVAFTYMLEGYDKEPRRLPHGSNIISYSSLPAGDYKLIVRASGQDGIESAPGELMIHVSPPFYLSTPAIALYLLLATFVIARMVILSRRNRDEHPREWSRVLAPDNYPEAKSTPETTPADPVPAPPSVLSPTPPARPLALIVERDSDTVRALTDSLQGDFQTSAATDCEEIRTLLKSSAPDIILIGLAPESQEFMKICEVIRNHPALTRTPLLAITSKTDSASIMQLLMGGINIWMDRETDPDELSRIVGQVIALSRENSGHPLISPDDPAGPVSPDDRTLLEKSLICTLDQLQRPDFSVEELSSGLGISRVHLYKKLKALTGKTPIEFIRSVRLRQAAVLLLKGDSNVSEVAASVGFNSPKYFARYFKEEFRILPSDYRDLSLQ